MWLDEIPKAFEGADSERAEAIVLVDDALITQHRSAITDLAAKRRLPVFAVFKPFAESGALMAYGPSTPALYRRVADYIARILNGANPSELPVERPTVLEWCSIEKWRTRLGWTIAVSPRPRRRGDRMRRRHALAIISGAMAWPLAARAQQSRLYRIGAFVIGLADVPSFQREFREGVRELGRLEGRDYVVELRSADGELSRLPTLAAELVRLKVDVIVALFTPCGLAAKEATREIPIIVMTGDPLGTGFIKDLTDPVQT